MFRKHLTNTEISKDLRPGLGFIERCREMDYLGGILTIGALVSGVIAVSFGGLTYPWNSGKIIGMFVCSGVLFILLGLQQVYTILTTTSRRIFPVEFFKSRTILLLFVSTAAAGTTTVLPIYMIPTFFQFVHGDSALTAGVRLLPYILLMVFACIANGAILSAYGVYMPWYTAGGILIVIGGALMNHIDVSTSTSAVYGYSVIVGFGVGLFVQASFSVAQAVVKPGQISSAVGFITCAQVSGITISLAIANSVFLNGAQTRIEAILPGTPLKEIQAAISGTGSSLVASLTPAVREKVIEAIVESMSKTYILVIVAGVMVLIGSFAMKREKLFLAPTAAA